MAEEDGFQFINLNTQKSANSSLKIKVLERNAKFSDYMKKEPMRNFRRMPKIVG